ncbi:FAD-dependent oxidoreductase [bacterium]|nr:FAD-dependent oxidoreductase [bacterium]
MSSFPSKTEIMVVGAGVAGVIAAIAARRAGCDVVLVEAHSYPGGIATQALVQPYQTFHSPRGQVIRGLAEEYIERLISYNGSLGHKPDPLGFATTVTPVDDRVARRVLLEWIDEEGVELYLSTAVTDVKTNAGRITALKLATLDQSRLPLGIPFGHWQRGTVPEVQTWWMDVGAVVDATGNAGVARLAGVECELSDECQPMSWLFALAGVDEARLRKHVHANQDDFVLNPDKGIIEEGYLGVCGFFSLVEDAKARGEWLVPRDRLLFFGTPHPGEFLVNTTRIPSGFGTDEEIAAEGIRQIEFLTRFFKKHVPGFKDSYISRKAEYIGVRESWRAVGRYVLTREDVIAGAKFDDVVALGAFPIDIHSADDSGLHTEKLSGRGHYDIPLRCLLTNEVGNLVMAGRHISVTREAFASTRVIPTSMAVGQAAGATAAVMTRGMNVAVDHINEAMFTQSMIASPDAESDMKLPYSLVHDLLLREDAVLHDDMVF